MKEKYTFGSGFLILELTFAIAIFAIAGAVCMRLLVKADDLTRKADAITQGVNYTSSAAELIRASETPLDARILLEAAYPSGTWLQDTYVAAFPEGTLRVSCEEKQLSVFTIVWEAPGQEDTVLQLKHRFREVTP